MTCKPLSSTEIAVLSAVEAVRQAKAALTLAEQALIAQVAQKDEPRVSWREIPTFKKMLEKSSTTTRRPRSRRVKRAS